MNEASVSVCCELPGELVPAAVVVEESPGAAVGAAGEGGCRHSPESWGGRGSPERSPDGVGKVLG